jgi:sulfoxide reductase heme-binding subunit YedZ
MIAATHGPSALWYATRGSGAMTLVLLTASVVLGIGEVRRWQPVGAPRFAIAALHRTISLLALVLLTVHIATTLLDPFPRIGVLNAGVPFVTDYRPLWMGLGTLASDILVALVLTSLVRRRLGYRVWRGLHWAAYSCWPVAVLHGLGSGSDTKTTWMLALTLACVGTVVVAVGSRLAQAATRPAVRVGMTAVTLLSSIGLAVWLAQGPLAGGWARRAGTPAAVLAAFSPRTSVTQIRAAPVDALAKPFTATLAGTIHNGLSADGIAVVDLSMRLRGRASGMLRIQLGGQALPNGGLRMDRSAVTLGPRADPTRYQGRIEFLQNSQVRSLVGSPNGRAVRLTVELSLGQSTVRGQVHGTPVRSAGA